MNKLVCSTKIAVKKCLQQDKCPSIFILLAIPFWQYIIPLQSLPEFCGILLLAVSVRNILPYKKNKTNKQTND